MRSKLDQLVNSALASGSAVPAFTCYDFTTALAVVGAAEEARLGVILLVAPKTASTPNGLRLITALRGLADDAAVPVSVQLDHASDLKVILSSVSAGADAVLADGSSLPYEDNIALVREVRAALDSQGAADVVIEAELGGLAGDEDKAFGTDASTHDAGTPLSALTNPALTNPAQVADPALTNPAQVADFVERTGAQLLAVAVGNVHGKYKGEPNIRWDVLQEVAARTEVPLVLHGASGIPADELAKAPSLRVGKVNFNTELRTGILATLETETAAHRADGENLQGLLARWNGSAAIFAGATLELLSA